MVEHPSDELISAYADNELEADARQAIASHLESCAVCRQRLSELDWARQRLATLRQESWRPEVSARVMSRITGPGRIWWLRRIATQVAAAASMALVLLVMGAATVILLKSRPQQQAELPISPDTAKALKERPEGKGDLSSASGLVYIVDGDGLIWDGTRFTTPEPPQILVFEPARGEVVRRIPVGHAPQVVASPRGDRLYVKTVEAEGREEYLSVLDAASGRELVRTEAIGKRPMALSPDGRFLYLLHVERIGDTPQAHLNVFDTQALQMLAYDIPSDPVASLSDSVSGVYVSPDGSWLYVLGVEWTSDRPRVLLEFIEVARREVVETVELADESSYNACLYGGVFSPDGRYFYAVNFLRKRVVVIDVTSRSIVRSANFDPSRVSGREGLLQALKDLWISTAWAKEEGGCPRPPSVAISPDGSRLYVDGYLEARRLSDELWGVGSVVDTNTLEAIAHISSRSISYGRSLVLSPDGRYLFGLRYSISSQVGSPVTYEHHLMVVDTASNRTVAEFTDIGVSPTQIFVLPR